MLRWLRSLFGRGRRDEASPIREAEAYARSYGNRSGEIVSVVRQERWRRFGWLHEALAAPVLGVFTVLTGLFIDACWTRGRHAGNLHEI